MRRTLFITAIALGLLLRVVVAWFSIGSNDAFFWLDFARSIQKDGLIHLYQTSSWFNHPPIPGLAAWLLNQLSEMTGLSFWFLFKLPDIAADALSCWLLWQIGKTRGGDWGRWAAVAFAWNLTSILVTGYHCNTDPMYAALSLLAAWFIVDRRNFLAAGLALAAAINVKIIPLLLIPPLASTCGNLKDLRRFLLGLSAGVLPFLPVLFFAGPMFMRVVLGYNSFIDRWGISFVLGETAQWAAGPASRPSIATWADWAMNFYHDYARYLIFAAILVFTLVSRRLRRWNAYTLIAITYALFLVLTPGFGVQYTVIIAPAILAVSLPSGSLYGFLAGVFLLLTYWANWTGDFPPKSKFESLFPLPGALFGLLAWWTLARFTARSLICRTVPAELEPQASIKR